MKNEQVKNKETVFIANRVYKTFDVQMSQTEDVFSPSGAIRPGKKGKVLNFDYGIYKTSDSEEINFLKNHPSIARGDPTRTWHEATEEELNIIHQLENNKTPKAEWHERLHTVLDALKSSAALKG